MIYTSRSDAGKKLASYLLSFAFIRKHREKLVVISLVRGGVPVGYEVARRLVIPHYPLVVKKIGSPGQVELAIGALCGNHVFLNKSIIKRLKLQEKEVEKQIIVAKKKYQKYLKKFKQKSVFVKDKLVLVVDDGIATGSSVFAACLALQKKHAKTIYLAAPVAPVDFNPEKNPFNSKRCFDKVFTLYISPRFCAVSQFYRSFPQISDIQAMAYFRKNNDRIIVRANKN